MGVAAHKMILSLFGGPAAGNLIGQRHLARGKDPNGLVPFLRLLAPARPPEAAGLGQADAEG